MKRFYIFTALFFIMGSAFSVNAQDLIILKDGNTIEAKVIEISPTEIRYKRFDHLDGPTVVIMAVNVLSIRYENGRTEVINTVTQPTPIISTQPTTVQAATQPDRNPRFNTFGVTIGYLGVSNFGFSLSGTVSPGRYTFFDFNAGIGFADFSFNGNVNFNGFVPFNKGGWYIGLGLGGGVYESVDSMNGFFAVNAITGFLFFNWLNISVTLQMEVVPEFDVRFKPMVGYVYRFKPRKNSVANISNNNLTFSTDVATGNIPRGYIITNSYTVKSVVGNVQSSYFDSFFEIKIGDVLSKNTFIKTGENSSVVLVDENDVIINIPSNCNASIGYLIENRN